MHRLVRGRPGRIGSGWQPVASPWHAKFPALIAPGVLADAASPQASCALLTARYNGCGPLLSQVQVLPDFVQLPVLCSPPGQLRIAQEWRVLGLEVERDAPASAVGVCSQPVLAGCIAASPLHVWDGQRRGMAYVTSGAGRVAAPPLHVWDGQRRGMAHLTSGVGCACGAGLMGWWEERLVTGPCWLLHMLVA